MRISSLALVGLLVLVSAPASAAPPIVNPGECVYLYGAPPGAAAATHEDTVSGTRIFDYCGADTYVTTGGTSPTSVEVGLVDLHMTSDDQCSATAWTGHRFALAPGGAPALVRVDIAGSLNGAFLDITSIRNHELVLSCDVSEVSTTTAVPVAIASAVLMEHAPIPPYLTLPDEPFSSRFEFTALPGRAYEVALRLTGHKLGTGGTIDFGTPGSGRGAHYDSIQVCVEEPPEDVLRREFATLLSTLGDDDLESRLYARECKPTVWMPAAQGGRLEAARSLAADLLARAVATGDPGVNAHVATQRLVQADDHVAAGQYQRACRSLSEVVRALTTP